MKGFNCQVTWRLLLCIRGLACYEWIRPIHRFKPTWATKPLLFMFSSVPRPVQLLDVWLQHVSAKLSACLLPSLYLRTSVNICCLQLSAVWWGRTVLCWGRPWESPQIWCEWLWVTPECIQSHLYGTKRERWISTHCCFTPKSKQETCKSLPLQVTDTVDTGVCLIPCPYTIEHLPAQHILILPNTLGSSSSSISSFYPLVLAFKKPCTLL